MLSEKTVLILDYLRNQRYDKIEDMKYEKIKEYKEEKNRRIIGLKKKTYEKCVEILRAKYKEEHIKNVRKSGRKSKLSIEDKMLATLEYLREYRTYAHIAASYGVHESQIVRCVRWVL